MSDLDFDPLSYEELPPERRPTLAQALVPVAGMLVFLGAGRLVFGLDPQFPLLLGIAFTALCARRWFDLDWRELYDGAADSITMGLQAVLILFIVYALIATWIAAGTIPAIMYYGLGILTPKVFLPAACALAAVVAFSIGSSWTTAGTLGVAFIGIGHGLGIPAPMTAGAILSGAYAGDKQSPLSDTTNLAAAATETDLFEHVDAMRVGTVIAFLIALVGYAALGLHAGGDIPTGQVDAIRSALVGSYDVGLYVLLPLVVTFALALYGVPALPSLGTGVFAGILTTIVFQEGPSSPPTPSPSTAGPSRPPSPPRRAERARARPPISSTISSPPQGSRARRGSSPSSSRRSRSVGCSPARASSPPSRTPSPRALGASARSPLRRPLPRSR